MAGPDRELEKGLAVMAGGGRLSISLPHG